MFSRSGGKAPHTNDLDRELLPTALLKPLLLLAEADPLLVVVAVVVVLLAPGDLGAFGAVILVIPAPLPVLETLQLRLRGTAALTGSSDILRSNELLRVRLLPFLLCG